MTNPEAFPPPQADRPPTADEVRAAERAARNVDVENVASHEDEMNELGKNAKGEGEIEPTSPDR